MTVTDCVCGECLLSGQAVTVTDCVCVEWVNSDHDRLCVW